MFAFATASAGYAKLANEMDSVTGDLTHVLSSLDGLSGLPIAASINKLSHTISASNDLAMSMQETSKSCEAQDAADVALSKAPTPKQVALAQAFARDMWTLYRRGDVPLEQAEMAADKAAEIADERQRAVDAHEAATSGTHFDVPDCTPWSAPGIEPGAEKKSDGDDPWGDDDGSGGYDEDENKKKEGDESSTTQPPADAPTPTTPKPSSTEPHSPRIDANDPAFNAWLSNQQPDAPAPSTVLSSADGPSVNATTTPSYATTVPQPQPVANQPTTPSPSYMQPSTPQPTTAAQTRPYGNPNPANHPARQTERSAEERQVPLDGAAAVMATQSHVTSSPAPMPASTPTPTAPTAPATPPMGQTTPGQTPAGQPPVGTAPVGAAPVAPGGQNPAANAKAKEPAKLEIPEEMKRNLGPVDIAVMETLMGIKRPEDAARDARAAMAEQNVGAPR